MKIRIEETTGFYGIGIWVKPHLKLLTFAIWKWQIRFYFDSEK